MSRWEILIVKIVFTSPSAYSLSWNKQPWMRMRNVYYTRRKGTSRRVAPRRITHKKKLWKQYHCECLKHIFFPILFSPSYCLPLPPFMPTSLSAFVFLLCNKSQGRKWKWLCKCQNVCFWPQVTLLSTFQLDLIQKSREGGEMSLIEI